MFSTFKSFKTASSFVYVSNSRERLNQSSLYSSVRLNRFFSVLALLLTFVILFAFSIIPLEFCHAVGTPTFWDSRVYPMSLVEEGSELLDQYIAIVQRMEKDQIKTKIKN